ncbi:hypothetical protein FUAX_36220 [Fulvitalea axinellae]|uniref:Uncharacterized protein n=1 Tax=Fulvitalea axinellae TaxID=1182444 RepID=A0AAU9DFA2_9BACT|nr:hypothetical protein FUAX_36220 [Fulvitalea axinellae]
MDKFRIEYRCRKQPNNQSELQGFEAQKVYVGRTYNGLYEVSPDWGSGARSALISGSVFREYFELLPNEKESSSEGAITEA